METPTVEQKSESLLHRFQRVRQRSEALCQDLQPEDYVVQPIVDVSPPKWHLGHTTWFFEQFVLGPHLEGYQLHHEDYAFVFNSYYETVGARVVRTDRGNLSRPTVQEVYAYRSHVTEAMSRLLSDDVSDEVTELIELGLNHEEQHQELLAYDIKYILGNNPLQPSANVPLPKLSACGGETQWIDIPKGRYQIGFNGQGFCFDNELGRHEVWLPPYRISNKLVSNGEYLRFIEDGGYQNFRHWLSEGWGWVQEHQPEAPQYWQKSEQGWKVYTMDGVQPLDLEAPVQHLNFYEADAYASWAGLRLPTEFEWEVAAEHFEHNQLWQWTNSAYLAYPGFEKAPGAIGEYNGKFMINQMVLRGGSIATPAGHFRPTYRNFFHPHLRWHFTGLRLADSPAR